MKKSHEHLEHHISLREKIFAKQVEILHKNLLTNVIANFVCATIVFISLHQFGKNTLIFSWFVAVIFVTVFRLIALYFYDRHHHDDSLHLLIFIFGMALSALLWGTVDSVLMPQNNIIEQMIIIVIVAGITSGGIQTLNSNLTTIFIYIFFIVFPLCVWLFLQNGVAYLILGVAMTAYLLFMLVAAIRGYNLLKKALTLHYENLTLIKDLSIANKKLLHSFKTLELHEHDIMLIHKMNDMLQTCHQSEEAYAIILFAAKELFSNFSGGLVILNFATNNLETVNQWGNDQALKSVFTISDCWALRNGHNYQVNDPTKNLMCYHFNVLPHIYLCLPLIVQKGTIGLLVIHTSLNDEITNYHAQLATSFCEVIQLSLTNIKLHETLYEQAIHDPLTGLFNRRYMDETLARELQRIIRDKKTLCVAMLDLDLFKRFNDTNGHEAGDEVLKFLGALLKTNFRGSDIACRFGGEEFVVILVNSDLATSTQRLEQIREAVKKAKVYFLGQLMPPITLSIGIAEAPLHGSTIAEIIRAADEALYAAKQAGRDRVMCFGSVTLD